MISSAVAIYETIQIPRPPDLRRSSRNPVIDTAYQTHENLKKYYKTRTVDINNVYKIYKNIKYLKYRFTIILNMMIEKYGESFGLKCFIINKVEEVIPILKRAMEVDGPSLIEFKMSLELNTSTTSISELHGI